jgi:single-strand DNA-binding protein
MDLNKVFILGRLTADPQLRSIPSGAQVATFSVATNRVWNDKSGNRQEQVEYHNIVVWGRQAEVAGQFLKKGSVVLI